VKAPKRAASPAAAVAAIPLKLEEARERAHALALKLFRKEHTDAAGKSTVPEDPARQAPYLRATVAAATEEPAAGKERPLARFRLRLRLWRLVAECAVEQNAITGELISWRNLTEARVPGEPSIDSSRACEIARAVAGAPPPGAEGPEVLLQRSAGIATYEVSWYHFAAPDCVVEGDKISVAVNAATGRPIGYFRKWREVGPTPPPE